MPRVGKNCSGGDLSKEKARPSNNVGFSFDIYLHYLLLDKGERDLDLSDSLDTLLAMDRAAVNLLQQND